MADHPGPALQPDGAGRGVPVQVVARVRGGVRAAQPAGGAAAGALPREPALPAARQQAGAGAARAAAHLQG